MTKKTLERRPLSDGAPPRVLPSRTDFGRRFTKWIRDQGFATMQEVAEFLDYSRDYVIKVRRGDLTPTGHHRKYIEGVMSGSIGPGRR